MTGPAQHASPKLSTPIGRLRDISKAIMAVFTQPEERVCAEVFTVGDYSQQFTKRMIVGEVQNGLGGMQIEYRPEIH